MVIRFTCEYSGKNFHGFQRQRAGLRSVQAVLEEALSKYFGGNITIAGSGRTDAGVHARGQVVSFKAPYIPQNAKKTPDTPNMYKLCASINAFLPKDVSVRDFEIKPDDFHAQFSAKAKTYLYKCYVSKHRSALRDETHLHVYDMPDLNKMLIAIQELTGTRSFKEFTTDKTDSKDFVRTIFEFAIERHENDEIHFIVRGSGFMRNMVRILCGRVLDIGLGVTSPRIKTLPPHGLILDSVEY